MIGYVTIGTNDLARALSFYDKILVPLGGRRLFGYERMQFYKGPNNGVLAICLPHDELPATVGNGAMFGLPAPSSNVVDDVYRIALASGAVSEGEPGPRIPSMYIAYFRDPDGNKLAVYSMGSFTEFAQQAYAAVGGVIGDDQIKR